MTDWQTQIWYVANHPKSHFIQIKHFKGDYETVCYLTMPQLSLSTIGFGSVFSIKIFLMELQNKAIDKYNIYTFIQCIYIPNIYT